MSDHDIDRIRIARDAALRKLIAWADRQLAPREPIVIDFCAGDLVPITLEVLP